MKARSCVGPAWVPDPMLAWAPTCAARPAGFGCTAPLLCGPFLPEALNFRPPLPTDCRWPPGLRTRFRVTVWGLAGPKNATPIEFWAPRAPQMQPLLYFGAPLSLLYSKFSAPVDHRLQMAFGTASTVMWLRNCAAPQRRGPSSFGFPAPLRRGLFSLSL